MNGNKYRNMRLIAALLMVSAAGQAQTLSRMDFLGSATLPYLMEFDNTVVGGLSGITYDSATGSFLLISDDRSERSPARFYTASIDLRSGKLGPQGVRIIGATSLRNQGKNYFEPLTIDTEGIALAPSGALYIASEGFAQEQELPFIRRFSTDGSTLSRFPIPRRFRPTRDHKSGIRHNLGFEALTASPDGSLLFVGTENALYQDGPRSDLAVPSPTRILKYDLQREKLVGEYLYWVEAVTASPRPRTALRTRGLAELLALDNEHLLALERAFSEGVGHEIHLYLVSLEGADDISQSSQLDPQATRPVRKELLFDFADLGIRLDNIEGMTFGPDLPDGRRTMIFVSDDNFSSEQRNLFLAFAVTSGSISLPEIQGAGHASPLEGSSVLSVRGIVTAVESSESGGFWIQGPSSANDTRSPNGIFVAPRPQSRKVRLGDEVSLSGLLEEKGTSGLLTQTQIAEARVEVITRGNSLPRGVLLGRQGRPLPTGQIDDDGLTEFEPAVDAVDYFESLEGLRVEIPNPLVVGPTTSFGTFTVLADGGASPSLRSSRGGLLQEAGDFNPERLLIDCRLLGQAPSVHVGDRFSGSITGVVSYAFGSYRILPSGRLPAVVRAQQPKDATSLIKDATHLTAATFNVLNLDAHDPPAVFQRLARAIVQDLGSPDILGLQEIQDDSGASDDGVVAATQTFSKLLTAIAEAGGPTYLYRQIDPVDGADGGQPGSNIRVALLFNPARVTFFDRGRPVAGAAAGIVLQDGFPRLSPSPGQVSPTAPAFTGGGTRRFGRSRKPLVAEVAFQGHRLFVIVAHLKSKRGDDALFGATQPAIARTEAQRVEQTRLIAKLVNDILALEPGANIIVLGDMNEQEFRLPLQQLTRAGSSQLSLTNLMEWVPATDRYSYNYRGNSQLLDHILISPNLVVHGAPDIDILHLNADFAASVSSSDHDPVLLRLELPPVP